MKKVTNAELIARLDAAAEQVNAEIDSTIYDDGILHYERRVELDGVTYLSRCAFTAAQQSEAWDGQDVHAEELLPWDDAEWTWYKLDEDEDEQEQGRELWRVEYTRWEVPARDPYTGHLADVDDDVHIDRMIAAKTTQDADDIQTYSDEASALAAFAARRRSLRRWTQPGTAGTLLYREDVRLVRVTADEETVEEVAQAPRRGAER